MLGRPERHSLAGHTPHDAGRLVLRNRATAAVQHLLETPGAVLAHSGEDHADGIASGVLRYGAEQHIDRRFMPVDRYAVIETADIPSAIAYQHQVTVAGGDIGVTREHVLPVLCLADRHRAAIVHASREGRAEGLGDVLR